MVNLSKGTPVRFTKDDKYKFVIDTTYWSEEETKELRDSLLELGVNWHEGYYLSLQSSTPTTRKDNGE